MCGINGFNFRDLDLIERMNKVTKHRGPDGGGVFVKDNISLGHDRLSIIDLSSSASQPMTSRNGNTTIVFNGEIYNYRDLKQELEPAYSFRTQSDTEVILAAYQKWGRLCVKRLNGMFAFAIWDAKQKELFLARDHIGIKPLYYFFDGSKFIFSSEIKALLEHPVPRVLDRDALQLYLRVLYVPEPLTMFQGIKKLPPASVAVVGDGKFSIEKYWDDESKPQLGEDKKDIADMLRKRVREAVARQLVSDRPLGLYLSGGIDSSVVLDSMAKVRDNIDTFSVGFDLAIGEEPDKFNADFTLARRTAAHYGTNHHEVFISYQDILDDFEKCIWHMDEPISNPTALAMFKLARFTKSTADVVLGGDGGDELFGGYDRYRMSLAASYYQKLPALLRSLLSFSGRTKKLNVPAGIERFELFMFQKDNAVSQVLSKDFYNKDAAKKFFLEKYFADAFSAQQFRAAKRNQLHHGIAVRNEFLTFEEKLMEVDRKSWLVDFSLMLTDKMSMSAGLEARVPLLDKNLVEFSMRIPLKYKIGPRNTKIILKEAFLGEIPDFLFHQPKRGWFSPGAKWLRYPQIYAMAKQILSPEYYAPSVSLFEWDAVAAMLESHYAKKEYNLNMLWALLTFQVWARQHNIQP